jgi:hypothetical protein
MHEPTPSVDGCDETPVIEHLATWQEEGGHVVVLGLDATCRPSHLTTLHDYR